MLVLIEGGYSPQGGRCVPALTQALAGLGVTVETEKAA